MHLLALAFVALTVLAACGQPVPASHTPAPIDRNQVVQIVSAIKHHAADAHKALKIEIAALEKTTSAFLAQPDEQTLLDVQTSWRSAHLAYASAQFGFLALDDNLRQLIYRIDAWPIQPGFIDDLPLYPTSGIINDETLSLNAATLISQHGITDEEEVALGFHSLEYLIFARPISDFASDSDSTGIQRRRAFLALATRQLVIDSDNLFLASAGQFDATNYPAALSVLKQVLTGNLQKLRVAFRESNLVTANDAGHSIYSGTSLNTLQAEIESLDQFMVGHVPMEPILLAIDANAYSNFRATLAELRQLLRDSGEDEVSRANLPLFLSALIHELEAFDRMLVHQLPAS
ncbi:MAG: putative iron-regulated protein [Candidatus Azotimanducaceae bacterium]|jgi:uncharacterized iron-regulated protein